MATAWAHLPNAKHIDQILAHLERHPRRWNAAWCSTGRSALDHDVDDARIAAGIEVRNDRVITWNTARSATEYAARVTAWDEALAVDRAVVRKAAWEALQALLTWDDCAPILDMPADAVRLLAAVGHHPAVLLLPAVLALEVTHTT